MIPDIFDVQGKVVVITGGAGQLGRQFCKELLNRGARVAIFDLDGGENIIADEFGHKYRDDTLLYVPVDITNKESLIRGLDLTINHWSAPHALVNNAALDSPPNAPAEENGPFETYPEKSWDKVMEVNVKGLFLCCQVIGGKMAESGRGSIINISSTYGLVSPDQRLYEYRKTDKQSFFKPVAYSASKSAVLNLTRYLATYWSEKKIRVNTLTFGGVFNNQDEAFLKGYCAKVPLGRMANEDEYNGAIVFLISDASSYMTGSNLVVDGGWTAW